MKTLFNRHIMSQVRLFLLILATFAYVESYAQLLKPLGLGDERCCMREDGCFWPQLKIEGDILFACTNQGLYSKDLSDDGSEWQLVGFNGIPLQNYARRGEEMLVLRYDYEGNSFLLLSHDEGKTYEDITPENIKLKKGYSFVNFEQHPIQSEALIMSSLGGYGGIYKSADFGQTWNKISSFNPVYTGFHPSTPDIIYEAYGEHFDVKNDLYISYDGGQTWQDKSYLLPEWNLMFRIAFHPVFPERWIAGGGTCVYSTRDNGQTWETKSLRDPMYDDDNITAWRYTEFDNKNPDIIYMAGHYMQNFKLMYSADAGATWSKPYFEKKRIGLKEEVYDMKQHGDKLYIYAWSDVYEISKAELLAELATPVRSIGPTHEDESAVYDLQGRRAESSKLSRGIYIQGGRKTITQ